MFLKTVKRRPWILYNKWKMLRTGLAVTVQYILAYNEHQLKEKDHTIKECAGLTLKCSLPPLLNVSRNLPNILQPFVERLRRSVC